MRPTKIAIIGSGNVGSTAAYALLMQNIPADITLVDIDEVRCAGEVLDLSDALPFSASTITQGSLEHARDADIIIITAGIAQKPGQSRRELLDTNRHIMASLFDTLKPLRQETLILVITNPVDALTLYVQQLSGLPHAQVFSSGTLLDSQRLRTALAQHLDVAEESVQAFVLGEHGDSQIIPWSTVGVQGIPILDIHQLSTAEKEHIAQSVKRRAYEIIACKGSTHFGIAACIATLCNIIINDQNTVVPLSIFIQKYGIYMSMPAVLGRNGIKKILSLKLTDQEQKLLDQSVQIIQEESAV